MDPGPHLLPRLCPDSPHYCLPGSQAPPLSLQPDSLRAPGQCRQLPSRTSVCLQSPEGKGLGSPWPNVQRVQETGLLSLNLLLNHRQSTGARGQGHVQAGSLPGRADPGHRLQGSIMNLRAS